MIELFLQFTFENCPLPSANFQYTIFEFPLTKFVASLFKDEKSRADQTTFPPVYICVMKAPKDSIQRPTFKRSNVCGLIGVCQPIEFAVG